MVCLIKSENKPLLDLYADILGSEDAAYYVLSLNNGYSLEFTPYGERSDLFKLLLAKNNYDYEAAIREKAEMYYSSFYNEIGGDWTMSSLDGSVVDENGEPKIDYTPHVIDFSDIINQPVKLDQMDYISLSDITYNLIQDDMNEYLGDVKNNSSHEIHSKKIQWLKEKQKKLVDSINKNIIKAFGLEKKIDENGNVYFVSKEKDSQGRYKVMILFCEYLENGKMGVYDLTGRLDAAANLIQISLTDADPTTFNHELIHHYIRMFWNSELIQSVAQKLDSGDRSEGWQVRLEEKVVDEIMYRSTDVQGFWKKFGEMIKVAFRFLSNPIKEYLLQRASIAFRINEQALILRLELHVLHFIDPTARRVFQTPPNSFVVEFDRRLNGFGLKDAVNLFIQDSIDFFERYSANPDSILKDQYDEYAQYFKHTLSGLNISDQDFNEATIIISDHYRSVVSRFSDPTCVNRVCADLLMQYIDEIRIIRNANLNVPLRQQDLLGSQARNKDLIDVVDKIMRGLATRVYEYTHTVPKEARKSNDVQQLIEKLNDVFEYDDKLRLFVSEGVDELGRILKELDLLYAANYNNVTSLQLMSILNTIDGFYRPIIDIILEKLGSDGRTIIHNGVLYQLGTILRDMNMTCSLISGRVKNAVEVVSKRITHDYMYGNEGVLEDITTEQEKDRFLENFDDELITGKFFEDVNAMLPYIGLASRSKSRVLRIVRNMILSANADIRHATLKDTGKIIKLYIEALPQMRKLGLKELLSVFQEMDEKGIPTGYFVRLLNHGKFYEDMEENKRKAVDKANQELISQLGPNAPQITWDYYNNPILPPDDNPIVKSILQDYADSIDEWQCENADRMFTADYYRMRRTMLSPDTRQIMSNIQSRINNIMSKCPVIKTTAGSIKATWELSPEDQLNLMLLQTEYKQLGNQYYSDGTIKSGDELRIAKEITRFNKWKGERVKYNQNELRFNAAIEEIRKVHGLNSIEEQRFRKLNTTVVVNPLFYDYVLSKVLLINDPRLYELRLRRNDLKKLISEFDKNGIDIELKRLQIKYWDELKDVDSLIRELIEQLGLHEADEEKRWDTYFRTELVMYDSTTSLIEYVLSKDLRDYRNNHPTDSRTDLEIKDELIKKYQYTYTWYDKSGGAHESVGLVSVFTRQVPKGTVIDGSKLDAQFTINGMKKRFPGALMVQYSQLFSDIDENSQFYNLNFDRDSTVFVLPKHDKYENSKQWDIIQQNDKIHALYDALILLMRKNNQNIPNSNADNYKLPQITGRRLTILRRSGSMKEVFDALKYNWKNEWQLNDRDDNDINYEDEKIRIRANGTRINNVPVRYIKMLENKKAITSDVIGSVIAFTEMANNFVVKTQLASDLEIIKEQLAKREDYGLSEANDQQSTKNIVKQLRNMMDDQLYDNRTKIGDQSVKFGKKQQLLVKFVQHFTRLGRKLMLGYNFTSMTVGFFESAIRGMLEAFLGKDYSIRDFRNAWRKIIKHGPNTLSNAGGILVTNILVAKMQHFGISKSIKESYHSTERNRFIKLLSENIDGMFGFSLGDYSNSAFQLTMALSNVRFIEGDGIIETGFYTKHSLIKAYQKSARHLSYKESKKLAKSIYNLSSVSLDDAYELNDEGILQPKQEYAQYITKRIENRITGKCYQRLAEALGITPSSDNPGYGLLILLKPIGTLRSYLFTVIARNWNYTHDFLKRYIKDGTTLKEDDIMDGYVDVDAGNVNIGIHQGLIGWMKMMIPKLPIIGKMFNAVNVTDETRDLYNYAAKKVLFEVLSIVTLVGISTLFKALAKGAGDDDWWERFGYLTSVRLVNSFISVLDPTALLEVIKNISTLLSPLNDLMIAVTTLSDLIGLSGHSPLEEIKSGSYAGRSRAFRNIMRITPFGNMYEDLYPGALKSRANWYLQQDPLVWSSVGGAFDLLWGTDSDYKSNKK